MEKRASSKGHESPVMREVTAGPVSWDPQQDPLALSDPTCILLLLLLPADPGHHTYNDLHHHPGQQALWHRDTSTNVVTDGAQRTPGRPHPAHRPTGATPELVRSGWDVGAALVGHIGVWGHCSHRGMGTAGRARAGAAGLRQR